MKISLKVYMSLFNLWKFMPYHCWIFLLVWRKLVMLNVLYMMIYIELSVELIPWKLQHCPITNQEY